MRPFPTDPWHKVVLGGVSLEKWAVTAFRGETTFIQRLEAIFRERQLLSWHLGQSHFSGSGLRGHGQTVNVRYKQESFRWNLMKYSWAWVKARIKVSIGRSKKQKDDVSWVGRVANGGLSGADTTNCATAQSISVTAVNRHQNIPKFEKSRQNHQIYAPF